MSPFAPKPGWDGAFRAICLVARLANRARWSAEEGPLWGSDREGVHVRPQRQRSASRAGVASTRYARGVLLRPARSPCYWLRLASRISSRKASVATRRGLFRGSLVSFPTKESFGEKGYDVQNRVILDSLTSGNVVSSSQPDAAGPDLALGIPVDDLADGRMVAGHVGKEGVLLARRGNEYFAIGAVCSHYSGPLAEGIMVEDTVRCPWHHACFSLRTGEPLRAPALNPVPCWRVEQQNGTVYVREKTEPTGSGARVTPQPAAEAVVIVGGGAAGEAAAEMLRR